MGIIVETDGSILTRTIRKRKELIIIYFFNIQGFSLKSVLNLVISSRFLNKIKLLKIMTYMNLEEIYSCSIFRLGKGKNDDRENALALILGKRQYGDYAFYIDEFIIPDDFPETNIYEWTEIDPTFTSRISEIHNSPGFQYPAKNVEKLKEKYKID